MSKIAQVDSFYVGFYSGRGTIAYPYTFDLEECEAPGVLTYGVHGLGAWLLEHKRTYTHASDNGRLLGMGHRFGDTQRVSRDVVTVPLIDDGTGRVLGMASMQSYTPSVYGDVAVAAFEWLCRTVVAVLLREHEDATTLRELDSPAAGGVGVGPTFTDVIVDVTDRLAEVRAAIGLLRAAATEGRDVIQPADALDRLCLEIQQETFAVLTRPSVEALEPLSLLTPREREIAELIGKRLTNQQIADALTISLPTVKSHVYNVMRKFDVRQRAEIAAKLRPFG
jgi:DNA-binding CsgD family transcriptional regulator